MFTGHTTESDWEWADKRRTVFKTPKAGMWTGIGTFVVGMLFRGAFGDPNWLTTSLYAGVIAVVVAFGAPKAETAIIWLRHKVRLEDPLPAATPPAVPILPDRPRAEVTFGCDKTGWARLRVTNAGAGAEFSATIQLDGLMAGRVEGKQLYAKWELGDEPRQWLAAGQTQTIRLATMRFIGNVMEVQERLGAWTVHQAAGTDVEGVEAAELLDVTIVAKPDLVKPCRLQILLDADGTSKMARVGIDPRLERDVPQRVTDMRRLLIEVVDFLNAMPLGSDDAITDIWMGIVTHERVPVLLEQALGPVEAAAYRAQVMGAASLVMRDFCTSYLLGKAQRLTTADILPSFELPVTWTKFYERQPGWEWPDYTT